MTFLLPSSKFCIFFNFAIKKEKLIKKEEKKIHWLLMHFFCKNKLYKNNDAEISKRRRTKQEHFDAGKLKTKLKWWRFVLPIKIHLQKNDLNTIKVIFCDIMVCVIGVYNFILLKSSFLNILYPKWTTPLWNVPILQWIIPNY